MKTTNHQVNQHIIPADLPAEIIKVNIDTYTMQAHFLVSIPAINFEYWTFESNMITWQQMKDFTPLELEVIQAGKERTAQIRKYHLGEMNLNTLDQDNPLKRFTHLLKN